MHFNRREFLRRSIHSALGGAALYGALGNLQLVAAATQAAKGGVFADYKALVCVFLFGGNDSTNTLVPFNETNLDPNGNTYARYAATRPAMSMSRADIQAQALVPFGDGLPSDGASYGLHPTLARLRETDTLLPAMSELRSLFNGGQAAVVANVGTLIAPLTKTQYQNNPALAPAQLFSHDDQANFWQTSRADDANADGWGGRIADLLYARNPHQDLPMTMSLAGQSLFQRGSVIDQYVMQPCSQDFCGVTRIGYLGDYQNELGTSTFEALHAAGAQSHLFERAYATATRRTIANYERIGAALTDVPTWTTPFPQTSLGGQLRQVANLINARGPAGLNMRRQIFFIAADGYDTHDDQLATHPRLLRDLSQSLDAFYRATVQMGVANEVTTFTASDFGRTLSTNGDGTDHGWGGHHFVLGGAVAGGRFYGQMNSVAQTNNPDDAGYGQIIPTTSVDQYAATLATWFGVAPGELGLLFPNLGNFASSNLGFMSA